MENTTLIRRFSQIAIFAILIATSLDAENEPLYRLRDGDLIDLVVEGYPEYDRKIPIRHDGYISFPLIGDLKARDLTIPELATQIQNGLAKTLDQPIVFATLLRSEPNSIYVIGMVRKPGRYTFNRDRIFLLQAIALAEGIDYKTANFSEMQIWRDGKIIEVLDLQQQIENKIKTDLELISGDLVFVPSLIKQLPIYVSGAVNAPGTFAVGSETISPKQALFLAGGPITEIADLENAIIVRKNGDQFFVDLSANNLTIDLTPGDLLHIPNAFEIEKISITGAVRNPGQFAIRQPIDLFSAIAMAGGWIDETANLKKCLIIRSDGTQTQIDLLVFIEKIEPISNLPKLDPGDRLQIPTRLRINWHAILTLTSVITLIYNLR